jgi:hypothetical protein
MTESADFRWYRDPLTLMACSMLLVVILMMLGAFLPWERLRDLGAALWVSVAGTLSSALAAFVALWLGLTTNKRSEREAVARANLVAARVVIMLESALDRFRGLDEAAGFRNVFAPGPDVPLASFVSALAEPINAPTMDELAWLSPLPNHCAGRIARAFAVLDVLRREVLVSSATVNGSAQVRNTALERWEAKLSDAVSLLTVAIGQCEQAAALGGPIPSGEELYGDPDDYAVDFR